jgi:hypothetical protein
MYSLAYFLGSVLGCVLIDQSVQPSGLLARNTVNIGLAFWSTALTLNTVLTLLILFRLWRARRDIRCCRYGTLSSFRDIHEQALIPGMLISQIIESAASYALITIIFIVLYGLQNTSMAIFSVFLSKQRYDCIIDFLEKSSLIIPCP